jgi:hypothetical protein
MKPNVIAARQFWQGIMDDAIAKISDEEVVRFAQVFAERPGQVCVLQVQNHSVRAQQRSRTAKVVEASSRLAILNNTILDKIAPERRARRKS